MPPADAITIQRLAERYELPPTAAHRLELLLGVLVDDEHAPTSVRDRDAALRDHLADSLSGLALPLFGHDGRRGREAPPIPATGSSAGPPLAITDDRSSAGPPLAIADIGSGAGLPGLPLAIALPDSAVVLVDSNERKCAFIEAAAAACGLRNTAVVRARAEAWPAGLGRFDVVTARALARLDVVAEYAAPLLRVGGALVAWRGRRDDADEAAAAAAAPKLGLEQGDPISVTPYRGAQYRHLHVLTKIAETPPTFPRRPGIARKRPLGGPLRRSDREAS